MTKWHFSMVWLEPELARSITDEIVPEGLALAALLDLEIILDCRPNLTTPLQIRPSDCQQSLRARYPELAELCTALEEEATTP